MDIDFSNIGRRIQNTRIEQNMTQKQMADFLGISMSYISRLENGRIGVEIENFVKICDCLNISLYDVLSEKNNNIIGYMNKDLYELIMKCNLEKQKIIYDVVKLMIKNQLA